MKDAEGQENGIQDQKEGNGGFPQSLETQMTL